jgi:predicted NBD/HSP70 family sugar kinase
MPPLRNTSDLRDIQVLSLIYRAGRLTRRQIAEAMGMNATSVTRVVAGLAERDLVVPSMRPATQRVRGRPSEQLAIQPDAGRVVGLEFGCDHLVVVEVDAVGQVRHREQIASPPPFDMAPATLDAVAAIVRQVPRRAGHDWRAVRAVGVALHEIVDADGGWLAYADPAATPCPVRDLLERRLGRYVLVEDVSRAYAHAEHRFGAGRAARDMIYVFVGANGIGGGVYVNGQMLMSSTGLCGEIGHVVVDEGGALCRCGSRGCLETVASSAPVVRRFQDFVAAGVYTSVPDPAGASFADICRASGAGDKAAYLALAPVATAMAKALASAVNVTGAPTVIVGGPLRWAGEPFLVQIAAALKRDVIAGLGKHVAVRYAELPDHAGAWGAAGRAVDEAWLRGEFVARA